MSKARAWYEPDRFQCVQYMRRFNWIASGCGVLFHVSCFMCALGIAIRCSLYIGEGNCERLFQVAHYSCLIDRADQTTYSWVIISQQHNVPPHILDANSLGIGKTKIVHIMTCYVLFHRFLFSIFNILDITTFLDRNWLSILLVPKQKPQRTSTQKKKPPPPTEKQANSNKKKCWQANLSELNCRTNVFGVSVDTSFGSATIWLDAHVGQKCCRATVLRNNAKSWLLSAPLAMTPRKIVFFIVCVFAVAIDRFVICARLDGRYGTACCMYTTSWTQSISNSTSITTEQTTREH